MDQGRKGSEERVGLDKWRLEMASTEFGGQTSFGEVSLWGRAQRERCSCSNETRLTSLPCSKPSPASHLTPSNREALTIPPPPQSALLPLFTSWTSFPDSAPRSLCSRPNEGSPGYSLSQRLRTRCFLFLEHSFPDLCLANLAPPYGLHSNISFSSLFI